MPKNSREPLTGAWSAESTTGFQCFAEALGKGANTLGKGFAKSRSHQRIAGKQATGKGKFVESRSRQSFCRARGVHLSAKYSSRRTLALVTAKRPLTVSSDNYSNSFTESPARQIFFLKKKRNCSRASLKKLFFYWGLPRAQLGKIFLKKK